MRSNVVEPPKISGDLGAPPAQPATSTDEILVRALVQRRPEAIDELFARYGRQVYSLARRIVADDGLAEDVAQEVFLGLWRDPGKYDRSRGTFGSWLLSVTHHKSVDAVRREEAVRRRGDKLAGELPVRPEQSGVDEAVWNQLRREQVRGALAELPAPQREALALAYYAGYTQREVAEITGAPLGTVKTRMLTGLRRLGELLKDSPARDRSAGEGDPR
jgi:RNA polymerase sigma-70 factor (ECF subfamily)